MNDILAVSIDDNEQNLMLIEIFSEQIDLKIKSFSNPLEGLEFLKNNNVDILFTDYMMPELDGLELIKSYRENNEDTPIIMITAAGDDTDLKVNAFKLGANDFLNKPLDLTEFTLRTKNLLDLRKAKMILRNRAEQLEEEVRKATIELIEREHESLQILGKTAEWKDPETAYHVARVAHYSKLLAKESGCDEEYQDMIYYASPFHDIGKVGIPDRVLLKAGRLNDEEYGVMKKHPTIGHEILRDSKSKYLRLGAEISLSHHERYDGTGYPSKLVGEDIPISGRIVALADVFDALTSVRPYKNAWTFEDAIDLLEEEKGKHFDPKLVEIFMSNIDKVKKIYSEFQETI